MELKVVIVVCVVVIIATYFFTRNLYLKDTIRYQNSKLKSLGMFTSELVEYFNNKGFDMMQVQSEVNRRLNEKLNKK